MTDSIIEVSENDLKSILSNRVSTDHREKKRVVNKSINITLAFKNHLLPISQNYSTHQLFIAELIFTNCTFNEEVEVAEYEYAGRVVFENCTFNKNVTIKNYDGSTFSGDSKFEKDLTIFLKVYSEVIISGLSTKGWLNIVGTNIGQLNINELGHPAQKQKVNVKCQCKKLEIRTINLDELVFSQHFKIEENLVIENLRFNRLVLNQVEINSLLHLKRSEIKKIEFDRIIGSNKQLKISDDCIIGNINLPLDQLVKMDISDCKIETLKLSDANGTENILNIQNVIFTNLIFEKVYNRGLITLRELNIISKGIISINSSNLGKTDFIYCDFSKAEFEFQNSKVTEVFLSETAFPKQVKINGEMNYPQAELAFGQLNTAFQKQGDTIRALEYQSREIEAHYYNLKNWLLPKLPFIDFDKVSLGLNKLSNNFGRSWIRGVAFTFLIGIISFYCLVISTNEYRLGISLDFKFEFVQSFLKFMNPIRFFELENLFKKGDSKPWLTLTWYSYIWDFFGRVFITYGFYQTIQAFRRFGRR